MAGDIWELRSTFCVRTTPDPEAARRTVVTKGEAAVGEVLVEMEIDDPELVIDRAGGLPFGEIKGLALLAGETEEEDEEDILRTARKGVARGAVSEGHKVSAGKADEGAIVRV